MRSRTLIAFLISTLLVLAPATSAHAAGQAPATGAAPGGPGLVENFLPADKSGIATSTGVASTVWLTVQREGGLGEIYYPDLSTPSARALQFVVADRHGHAVRVQDAARVDTTLADPASLTYQQTFRERTGRWLLTATYVTDPARATVLVDVRFSSRGRYDVYTIYDPALGNTRNDDAGRTQGDALVATDASTASALAAARRSPRPRTASAAPATAGLICPPTAGWTGSTPPPRPATLCRPPASPARIPPSRLPSADPPGPRSAAHAPPCTPGSAPWRGHTARAGTPTSPASGARRPRWPANSSASCTECPRWCSPRARTRLHRGAFVAAPDMPWIWGSDEPSGPYHLVWSRDLYQIATALIAAGDTAAANRALDFLLTVQQKPDGSFPQNSSVDGTPVWTGLQLDEVAFPIVLAYQLGRTDAATWAHVKAAAEFIVNFQQDGNRAPWTPQERWENQSGYSPATIASEIAGLICAAVLARANGDASAAARYETTADGWQAQVKNWTVTTTGPYSAGPYFLRLTKDGNPNAGTTYSIGDSGPSNVDQRRVVDPSFLDLVRLGVLPATTRPSSTR